MSTSVDIQFRSVKLKAKHFLEEALVNGPVPVAVLCSRAKRLGISESTLKRVKKSLGILSIKSDFNAGWYWEIPNKITTDHEWGHQEGHEEGRSDVASETQIEKMLQFLKANESSTGSNRIAISQMALTMWHEYLANKVDIETPTIGQINEYLHKFAVQEKSNDSSGPHIGVILADNDAFFEIVSLWIERGDTNVWGLLQSVIMNLGRFIASLAQKKSALTASSIGGRKLKRLLETSENVKTFQMLRECEERLGVSHGYFSSVLLFGVDEHDRRLLWPAESDEFHVRGGKKKGDVKKHMMMVQNVAVEFARLREERIFAKKGPVDKDLNDARMVWSMLHLTSKEYSKVKNRWVKLSNLMNSLGIHTDANQIRLAKLP